MPECRFHTALCVMQGFQGFQRSFVAALCVAFSWGLYAASLLTAQAQSFSERPSQVSSQVPSPLSAPLSSNGSVRRACRPTIALALSGGGARGMVQLGVLNVLERERIPIDYITGTSIGAIIGGLYASGYSARALDSLLTSLNWEEAFGSLNERERAGEFIDQKAEADRSVVAVRLKNGQFVPPQSLSAGYRFSSVLNSMVWQALYQSGGDFNRLKIPFRAIATDLVKGKSVALCRGDLATAMRASATFPLRFAPVKLDSMLLVDGGLLANVPVEAARRFTADIVIAVDNTSPLLPREALSAAWTIADQAATAIMRSRSEAEARLADVLIVPLAADSLLNQHSNDDFTNLARLVAAGERAAEAALPQIRALLARSVEQRLSENCEDPNYPPARINTIVLRGVSSLWRDTLATLTRTIQDSLATPEVLQQLGNAVTMWYRQMGNSLAQARARVELPESVELQFRTFKDNLPPFASVVVECREGLIHAVSMSSDSGTLSENRRRLIAKELPLQPNAPFTAATTLKAWRNLMATNFFNDITINTLERADGNVDVDVRAEERATLLFRLGGRIDNERNVQGGLECTEENLFDVGLRSSLRLAGGTRNYYGQLTISAPRIFNSAWQLDVRGYASRTNLYVYKERSLPLPNFERLRSGENAIDRVGGKAGVLQQIERNGFVGMELRYEQQRFFSLDADTRPILTPLNTLKLITRFDTQDRAYFPTSGRTLDLSLELPLVNLAGGAGFSKMEVRYSNVTSWGQRSEHMVRPSFQFGFADLTLPETEYFSLGGEDLFYGMREDEMRGRQIALVSLEYRYCLPWRVFGMDTYTSFRWDTGTTWAEFSLIRVSSMRQGIGVSAALDTPFGPARVSLGKSFFFVENPNGAVWGPTMLYFSIGIKL